MKRLLVLTIILHGIMLNGQTVFPTPTQATVNDGQLVLQRKVLVCTADTAAPGLDILRTNVLGSMPIKWTARASKADICWQTDSTMPSEGYRIQINRKQILVRARDKGGFTYAAQTLRQWVAFRDGTLVFICADIQDAPRMSWRGFMLDSGRQFQQVATIKKYIDMASMLKMNYFHWHLTEGLGWRIEIKRYPRLAQIGGHVGHGAEQQGFYTQQEIREIVEYAASRHVTVVPEIDMPGHAEAAIFAYPELGCFGKLVEIPQTGFTHNIFCAGKDEVVNFLKDVLDEVCTLFPSPYIHLGGDEAPKANWNKCADCQDRIASNRLKDSHDLQLWFSAQMAGHLKKKGRKAIFWGDVVYRNGYQLPENVVIQWWNYRGHKELALRNASRQHYPVICSPNYYTYLNFPVTPWRGYAEDRTFGLAEAYLHNPADNVSYGGDNGAMGISCALWTDYGVTEEMIDERLFPRILALAELMWHQGQRADFTTFCKNIQQRKAWFVRQGYDFGQADKQEADL